MKQFEQNIMNSFRLAKTDILKTREMILELSKSQKQLMLLVDELKAKLNKKRSAKTTTAKKTRKNTARVKHVPARRSKKTYVATKTGKLFHSKNCPYAQNIKPKHKMSFKSKVKALNEGFKPCTCIK